MGCLCLLLGVLFPSLSTPTVNYSWTLTSQDSICYHCLLLPNIYTHRKHYDSLSEYILGVTTSRQKIKDTDWQVKGATTPWLKLQLANFLTEPEPASLNHRQTTGRECRASLPTVRAGSAQWRASYCSLQSRSTSLGV